MANLGSTKPQVSEEPDWEAKEAEVRESIKAISTAANTIVQGNASVANTSTTEPSTSTVKQVRPTAITISTSRSSRQILDSPSNSDYSPQDKPDAASVPESPSPERASRAFKPYRRPIRASSPTTTRAAPPDGTAIKDTSISPSWIEVNTPITPTPARPGYTATRSIRRVKPLDPEFESSIPFFFSGVSPTGRPSTEKMYRNVNTMTPVATYGELSTQELEVRLIIRVIPRDEIAECC